MTNARRMALILAVGLAIALAGCGALSIGDSSDGPDVNTSNYDAEELAQSAQTTMEGVETYAFSMEMDMDAGGQTGSASLDMEADGRANHATEQLYMDGHMDVSAGMRDASEDFEAYQFGDTMYMNVRGRWQTEPAQEGAWTGTGPATQSELLEDSEVSIEGAETVNGEDTLVISVDPDEETLEALVASQAGSGSGTDSMEIESASVTQYVAAEEPHYVMKSEIEMTAVAEGVTMELEMTMSMDDHDEDISIDVPGEIG